MNAAAGSAGFVGLTPVFSAPSEAKVRCNTMLGNTLNGATMIELKDLPKLPQRQDSVAAQLADLRDVANRLGLYDAADALRQHFGDTMAKAENQVRYGCHCDLDPHMEPDGCVIDEGRSQDCVYAREAGRKERCEYWRIVVPNAELSGA